MAKSIYDYRDSEGFVTEKRLDEWRRKNNLSGHSISERTCPPRWDGIFTSEKKIVLVGRYTERFAQSYLRFYPDGTVIYEHAVLDRGSSSH